MHGLRVVILTHGSGANGADLAARLVDDGVPAEAIAVVHNPATPGAPKPAVRDAAVDVLQTERNLGYTGGMNRGLEHQLRDDTEMVLLLTHDVRFTPGAVATLVDTMRSHPEYGVLGPELFDPTRGVMFSYGARMGRTGATRHLVEPPADEADGIVPCDSIDGAFMLYRADALRTVGRFDERLFIYAEEAEMNLRIRRAGYRVGVVRGARAEQSVGLPSRPGAYGYLMTRNGFNLAREAAGLVGIAGSLYRVAFDVAMYGRRVVDPRRTPEMKRSAWASVVGTVRGALDYFRGRWGPPPSNLPGLGDTAGS